MVMVGAGARGRCCSCWRAKQAKLGLIFLDMSRAVEDISQDPLKANAPCPPSPLRQSPRTGTSCSRTRRPGSRCRPTSTSSSTARPASSSIPAVTRSTRRSCPTRCQQLGGGEARVHLPLAPGPRHRRGDQRLADDHRRRRRTSRRCGLRFIPHFGLDRLVESRLVPIPDEGMLLDLRRLQAADPPGALPPLAGQLPGLRPGLEDPLLG